MGIQPVRRGEELFQRQEDALLTAFVLLLRAMSRVGQRVQKSDRSDQTCGLTHSERALTDGERPI